MARSGKSELRTAIDWYVEKAAARAPDDSEVAEHMRAQAENDAQKHPNKVLQEYRKAHGTQPGEEPRIVRSR